MQLSAYEIAIIGGGFTIVGALLGAWITYHFALCLSKINARREAGARLRAAFAPAIAQYDLIKDTEVDRMLRAALPAHAAAIEEYRCFVTAKLQAGYQKAWEDYHRPPGTNGSVFFLDYVMGEDRQHLFKQRIHAVLQFTEI